MDFSLALKSDGTVFDIGHNTNVVGVSNVASIVASGTSYADPLAIRRDGTVFDIRQANPNVAGLSNIAGLAFSSVYLGLQSSGTVVNFNNGNVAPLTCCATAIAVGGYGALALREDGTTAEFGLGWSTNTPLWAKTREVVAIAGGGLTAGSLALKPDGTLLFWNSDSAAPAGLSNLTATAVGYHHSLALKANGTVVAWGWNDDGQTSVPAGLSNVVAIAAGEYHSLALKSDGSIRGWGYNAYGQATDGGVYLGTAAISAGALHSLALMSNGKVRAWGDGHLGQCNVPPGLSNVMAIAAGGAHNLVLKSNGTIVAWGYNNHGQTNIPPGLSNVVAIAAGGDHSMALKSDGTVVAWGDNSAGESTVPAGLGPVIAISAGPSDSMALVLPSPPTLQAQLSGKSLLLSWPTNSTGFHLQLSAGMSPFNWMDSTNSPVISGGQFWATNAISGGARFFRLRK
jgi:alpha-tubulin suppressor-like RCC1 family protein